MKTQDENSDLHKHAEYLLSYPLPLSYIEKLFLRVYGLWQQSQKELVALARKGDTIEG